MTEQEIAYPGAEDRFGPVFCGVVAEKGGGVGVLEAEDVGEGEDEGWREGLGGFVDEKVCVKRVEG